MSIFTTRLLVDQSTTVACHLRSGPKQQIRDWAYTSELEWNDSRALTSAD